MQRHRKAGRKLDRHSQERLALFRTLTMSLVEKFETKHEFVLTSLAKAKEARRYAEPMITLAIKARKELDAAAKAANVASAEELRKVHVEGKKKFATYPENVRKHIEKSLHYRRLLMQRLGSTTTPKHRAFEFRDAPPRHERTTAVMIDKIAPRFIKRAEENPKAVGGYTRVLKTAKWVKGDGSTKALWGFVGSPDPTQMASPSAEKKEATVGAR